MPVSTAEFLRFGEMEPLHEDGAASWYARGQNFAIAYSRVEPGATLAVEHSEHEYFIVFVEGELDISSEAGSAAVFGRASVIVPPGRSEAVARTAGTLVRVFAPPPPAVLERCVNRATYEQLHPDVSPLELWPEPLGGYRLRLYEYDRMPEGVRGLRSRNLHVAWSGAFTGPVDPKQLFPPHDHPDFEHTFLCLAGEYIHHIRYPWEPDSTAWREDDHVHMQAPCLTILPPRVIHGSQAVGETNSMIDISAPPRADLSLQGRVYEGNARDYPLPPALQEAAGSLATST